MKLARPGILGSENPAIIDTQGRLRYLSEHLADIAAESLSDQLEEIFGKTIVPTKWQRLIVVPPLKMSRSLSLLRLNPAQVPGRAVISLQNRASGIRQPPCSLSSRLERRERLRRGVMYVESPSVHSCCHLIVGNHREWKDPDFGSVGQVNEYCSRKFSSGHSRAFAIAYSCHS
jgi:hypothetical protein